VLFRSLDRLCREKVIEAFHNIYKYNSNRFLFINIDASILDRAEGSNYLTKQVSCYGISPKNIVIEINETKVQDNASLKRFADTYRKFGFMVALDDVGTGFSNMDRILIVKPDIIKIDTSLVRNIHNDYYKQGVFRSLVNLSNKIGALVIAEGAETEEEAIYVLKLGGHMIQGDFFARPQEIKDNIDIIPPSRIETLSRHFNQYMNIEFREERNKDKRLNNIVSKSIRQLAALPQRQFNDGLSKIIWDNRGIECAYILSDDGIQISNAISAYDIDESANLLFYSGKIGTDRSMERYFYPLKIARLRKHVTEPYISLATGNLCITISRCFTNAENKKYILCMDFNVHADDLIKNQSADLPININSQSVLEMSRMIDKMNEEMIKDPLTGTFNRRYIEDRLLVDIYTASNENLPISVIMADLDHFKAVNDTFGHIAGDYVLKEFVRTVKCYIRKSSDWIARYGGEEFLIALFGANESVAFRAAEEMRQAVEKAQMRFNGDDIHITASFGTYTLYSPKITCEQLIDLADKNLYRAKINGRNMTMS
jgi:diguanylate cyclase (GGDEF)-like protein